MYGSEQVVNAYKIFEGEETDLSYVNWDKAAWYIAPTNDSSIENYPYV